MRRETFSFDGTLYLEALTGSGDVQVLEGPSGEVTVELRGGPEDAYIVELNGSDLSVRPPAGSGGRAKLATTSIKIYVAEPAAARIRTMSGDVLVAVGLESLTFSTTSGDCQLRGDVAGDVEVRSTSGDLKLESAGGELTMTTTSGDIAAAAIGGDFTFKSTSGDARLAAVAGSVAVKTVSGDVTVRAMAGPAVRVKSLSGDIRLGIPPGRTVELDMHTLSGTVTNRLQPSTEQHVERRRLRIAINSVSGSLRLDSA